MKSPLARAALAAALLLAASGCAFGNRTTVLRYPPAGEPPPAAEVLPATVRTVIAVQPVRDDRSEPRAVVGWVKNGFGMHTADVVTADDVAAWATVALRHELGRLGVVVVDEQPGGTTPVLGADLSRVHCSAYMTYSGEVVLRAWVRSGEAYPLNQVYQGAGSAGMNWAATGDAYGDCVARALQDAARRVAADAKRAVEQALAAAPPPAPRM